MAAQLAFQDARGGMNAFDPPFRIATNQVARMVNCSIEEGMPTTRMGARVVPLKGESANFVSLAPVQGSIFYNPAAGQGGISLATATASLALAAGGRKLLVTVEGRRGRATATPSDITDGLFGDAQNHLAWMSQWEDRLIVADGEGKTFIYQPEEGARFSGGFISTGAAREQSEIPNGATCLLYAHSRGHAVVNSREVVVSDNLFRINQATSIDLIKFTEQVFAATGFRFLPPTVMLGINALAVLALKNTQHGHGAGIAHCENGLFSFDTAQAPRSSWYDKQLVKIVSTEPGATGPYAVASVSGDQYYRSPKGVQTLRSAAATSGLEGNPQQTLSPGVDTWFAGDYPRWLRFASVCAWDTMRRIFFTVAPIVRGSFRWHRGIVVRNTDTQLTVENTPAVWEGLWTLPPQMAGVIQFVNGIFDGEQRQFVWTRGRDARNRLVEFSPTFRHDILEDGTEHAIRCQVITRAIDAGQWWESRNYELVRLYLRNIYGKVRWGVWFRPNDVPAWTFLQAGSITAPDVGVDPFDLTVGDGRSIVLNLGSIPSNCAKDSQGKLNESRSIQFLVRWEGYCSLEGIRVECGAGDLTPTDVDKSKFAVTFAKSSVADFSDWEYSEDDEPAWIK